jgi:hypothetical protein
MAALTPSPTLAVSCSHKSSLHYSEVKSESSFIFFLTLTDIEVIGIEVDHDLQKKRHKRYNETLL